MSKVGYILILGFLIIAVVYSIYKKNNTYNSFINGCKDSMKTGVTLLPFIMVMYVAVSVFNKSNFLDDVISFSGLPNEIFAQGIIRPVSSHASMSLMTNILVNYGPDSKEGIISSILQGGSDTTIYVMGLYFGYLGIKKTKYAYFVGLFCDLIVLVLCIVLFFLWK